MENNTFYLILIKHKLSYYCIKIFFGQLPIKVFGTHSMLKRNRNNMKKVKVKIKNSWLNALEDLLFANLDKKQKKTALQKSSKLWHTLVAIYDKKKKRL